jgi:ABC-type branched-subunit amino acid transport system substrate-binding protein
MKKLVVGLTSLSLVIATAQTSWGATPAAGKACTAAEVGKTVGTLKCVKDGRKKTGKWQAVAAAAPTTAAKAGAAATPAPADAGIKTGPGFDGTTIVVGNITSKTNAAWGPLSKGIGAALESKVKALNAKGGIAGKYPIKIEEYETNYDPNIAVQGLNATKDKVALYASVLGTPVNEALLPLYEQNKLVASPGSLDAKWIGKKNMMPILSSYQVQAINGAAYYFEQAGNSGKVMCGVSRQDAYGSTGTEGLNFAQDKLKFALGTIETVPASQTDFVATVTKLKSANCAAVYVTTGPAQLTALLVQGSQNGFTPQWIAMSPTFNDKQVSPATSGLYEKYVWTVSDGVEWNDQTAPGMKALVADLKNNGFANYVANPDTGLIWGYAQILVTIAVLEKAVANKDLSRDGILAAASQVGAVDLGGLGTSVDFSKRIPPTVNTIFSIDGSKQLAVKVLKASYSSAAAAGYRKN